MRSLGQRHELLGRRHRFTLVLSSRNTSVTPANASAPSRSLFVSRGAVLEEDAADGDMDEDEEEEEDDEDEDGEVVDEVDEDEVKESL